MGLIEWLSNNIELLIKIVITGFLLFLLIKTWKTCEDEIKCYRKNLDFLFEVLKDNIVKANKFFEEMCNIDLNGIENQAIFEARMNLYKISVKEYQEKFLDTINKQNENVKDLQNRIFDLRKNEWKSSFPFLSAIALMWLGIKL